MESTLLHRAPVSLVRHPEPYLPLGSTLRVFPWCEVDEHGRLSWTAGQSLREVLGLEQDWPGTTERGSYRPQVESNSDSNGGKQARIPADVGGVSVRISR